MLSLRKSLLTCHKLQHGGERRGGRERVLVAFLRDARRRQNECTLDRAPPPSLPPEFRNAEDRRRNQMLTALACLATTAAALTSQRPTAVLSSAQPIPTLQSMPGSDCSWLG